MPVLCDQHIHLIAQVPDGTYACSYCGLRFTEYHEIHVTVGMGAKPAPAS